MSPYVFIVILALVVFFLLLSLAPLLVHSSESEVVDSAVQQDSKAAS